MAITYVSCVFYFQGFLYFFRLSRKYSRASQRFTVKKWAVKTMKLPWYMLIRLLSKYFKFSSFFLTFYVFTRPHTCTIIMYLSCTVIYRLEISLMCFISYHNQPCKRFPLKTSKQAVELLAFTWRRVKEGLRCV